MIKKCLPIAHPPTFPGSANSEKRELSSLSELETRLNLNQYWLIMNSPSGQHILEMTSSATCWAVNAASTSASSSDRVLGSWGQTITTWLLTSVFQSSQAKTNGLEIHVSEWSSISNSWWYEKRWTSLVKSLCPLLLFNFHCVSVHAGTHGRPVVATEWATQLK